MSYNNFYSSRRVKRRGRSRQSSRDTRFANNRPDPSRDYIKGLLFEFDQARIQGLVKHYAALYGDNAGRYFLDAVDRWATGSVRMTAQSERRILECVPKFMTAKEQYKLLLLSAPKLIVPAVDWRIGARNGSLMSLATLHAKYAQSIDTLKTSTVNLEWFVKGVFSEQEIEEYVQCLRYVGMQKLQQSFSAVIEDLGEMLPLPPMSGCKISYQYVDYLYQCQLDNVNSEELNTHRLFVDIPMPDLITRIGVENARMIADRLLGIDTSMREGYGSMVIGVDEVQSFLHSIQLAVDGPDYDGRVNVKGAGGTMHIHITRRNLKVLRKKLDLLGMLMLATAALGILIVWLFISGAQWLFAFIFGLGSMAVISWLYVEADYCKKELSNYEC